MNSEGQKMIPVEIEKEMRRSYLDYSVSVIVGRALPSVRDGLKPVHRRILYTMYENGLYPEKPYRKCADTVGSVLGRYHPHGDASVYDALVRLAQDFSLRYPLVDGHGNFGSVDGDPPAAYRYTEAKMSKISMHILDDIDKDTVDFVPNYDDRLKEPVELPCRFPNLLVNGSTGIAVGMATNIPPHNMGEVLDAMNLLIDNPDATLEEIMSVLHGPDFPTAGIIMGRSGIRAAYATGRGKITLRGRAEIEEKPNGRFHIIVTEIPYQVNKANLIQSIAALVRDKRIEGISDLRDESDREGMRIVIELKRDANPQVVLNQLYSFTQLQDTYSIILLALDGNQPKIFTIKEMIQQYIRFQEEIITRRTKFDLAKARDRAHILEGLTIALDYIDEVISIIRASKEIAEAKQNLMDRFGLSDPQASAIVQMRLGQLTGLEREKIEQELAALREKIADLLDILANESRVLAIIKEESKAIRDKFNDERRTEIAAVSGEVDIEDLIPEEQCIVTLTHYGYIKRQPVDTYRAQRRGGRGVSGMTQRDDDFVESIYTCSTHDYLMFFTTNGRTYRIKGYEIPESGRTSKGLNIANLLELAEDEKVSAMICVRDFDDEHYITMVTRRGIIKRTVLSEYKNGRKKGLIAVVLDEGDELAGVGLTDGKSDLIIGTRQGMAIRFSEAQGRALGRASRGVRAIRLEEGDEVVGMVLVEEGKTLLSVTEKGFGKKTAFDEFATQNRGGKGVISHRLTEKTGAVAGIKGVAEDEDIMLISLSGVIIRIPADQVSVYHRASQGVTVMRVEEGNRLVTATIAPHEEEKPEGDPDDQAGEASQAAPEAGEAAPADGAQLPAPGADPAREASDIARLLEAAATPQPDEDDGE